MLQSLGGAVARTRPEFLALFAADGFAADGFAADGFAADGFAEPAGRFTCAVLSASPHRGTLS